METELVLSMPVSYELETASSPKKNLLILHGFSDNAAAARKRLLGSEAISDFTIFSPNGVFPCPVKSGDTYKKAYAWYFREPKIGVDMIPPEFGAKAFLQLLSQLQLAEMEWTIVGFSQGGFFAPYLVRAGLKAKHIFGIGSAYRSETYEGLPKLSLTAIHGDEDQIVDFGIAKSTFEKVKEMGYGKEFYSIPKLGHTLNDEGRKLLWRLINEEQE